MSASIVSFSDLVEYDIGGGWGTSAEELCSSDPAYVIRGTDIPRVIQGDLSTVPLRFHASANLRSRVLSAQDIVFEVSGGSKGQPVGRALLVTERALARFSAPVMCASFCKVIRIDAKVADPRFVFRVLQAAYSDGRLDTYQVQSTGITNFKWKPFLQHFQMALPSRTAQVAVASILDVFDDLIENNRRRVEVLEEMARTIYREWFVHFRYPGHEKATFIESTMGMLPNDWAVMRIGEICDRIQAGGTPSRSEATYWDEPEIAWYKSGELADSVLLESSERISRFALSSLSGKAFEPDTIMMAIYGATIGKLGLVESICSANQAALGLVPNAGRLSTEYLWFVLLELRDHFIQIAQGAAQQNISKQKVSNTAIVLPPIELIGAFTAAAGPSWRLSHVLRREAAELSALRDVLLPRLVTGQIDVSSFNLEALVEESVA